MDSELLTAAGAAFTGLLALLGLRRRASVGAAGPAVSAARSPGDSVASAGTAASQTVTAAVASLGHQVVNLATGAVGAVGTAVSKGAGLVVDGGVTLVETVRPSSSPAPAIEVPEPVTDSATPRRRTK